MNTKNTKGRIEFIIDHVWWAFIAWIWYRNILFRCLGYHSLKESKLILFGMILLCCTAGIFLQMKRQRNSISVLMNLLAGFGLYAVIVYFPIKRKFILISIAIAAVLAAACSILILCQKIKRKRKFKRILLRRVIKAGRVSRNLICISFAVIMLSIGINAVFGTALITPSSVAPAKRSNVEEQTISNNLDILRNLQEEKWSKLSVDEKLDVLQTIANIEQRYLGLPHELNVGAENLKEDLAGYYSDSEHLIVVSMDSLLNDTPYMLTNTIAHEAYHCLQHRMVDAYNEASDELKPLRLYNGASVYKEEFSDYVDGFKDFCGYYLQKCEEDARRYAENAADEYFERLDEYIDLAEQNPDSAL